MKKQIVSLIAAATIPALSLAAATTSGTAKGEALINKLTKGQLSVNKSFDVQGTNLNGYVVAPKQQPGQQNIFYTDKKGTYLIAGNVINKKGQNLTQHYTNEYITKQKAMKAYKDINKTYWVTAGSNKAPHKAYVFFDPNCAYCHLLHQKLQPYLQKGELQIRWVPVAIRPGAKGKTARIMHAKNDKDAIALIMKDEKNFDMKTEQGSLKPLKENSKDKSVQAAFNKTKVNTEFFIKNFVGTPVILFMNTKGEPVLIPGYIQGKQLQDTVNSMASHY